MEELGVISQLLVPLGNYTLIFNLDTILMTWIVIMLLLVFGFFATKGRKRVPGKVQAVGELLVGAFYGLSYDTLNEKLARKYAPMIATLFLFLMFSNWLGLIPGLSEPTRDLNTPLALGLLTFVISHGVGIREKGLKKYLKSYAEPVAFMAILNVVGEISKVVSLSFRIFGNIMGGSIIIMVVSYLTFSLLLPPLLGSFFGLFVGTIQAFVFTMLTLVYISVQSE